jgi:hypothetical protein
MDFFQSHQTVQAILPSSIFPNVHCTSKTAGSPRAEIDPTTCPQQSVTQGSTRILIYIDGLLCRANCAQAVAILPSSIFPRSIALVKRLGWFTKRAEIDPNLPHANKVLLKVARILIYMDGLLSIAPNCASRFAIFHIPERSIALVKRLAGSPKG